MADAVVYRWGQYRRLSWPSLPAGMVPLNGVTSISLCGSINRSVKATSTVALQGIFITSERGSWRWEVERRVLEFGCREAMSGAATAGLWRRLTLSGVGPKSMTGGIFKDAGVGEAYRGMMALSDPYVGGLRELGS